MRLRVVCGLSDTIASFVPTMRLSSVDLPALGRPMRDTKPLFMTASHRAHRDSLSSPDHRIGGRTFFPCPLRIGIRGGALRGDLPRDAHPVDPPPPDLEHLNREPVDAEPVADRGHAADAREQIAADGLEAFALDLDAEPLGDLVDARLAGDDILAVAFVDDRLG